MAGGRHRVVVGGEALVDLVPLPTGSDGARAGAGGTGAGGTGAVGSGAGGTGAVGSGEAAALAPLVPRRGGGPYNTAIGLGRLDVPVTMLTRLSTDAFGDALLTRLGDNGVDTALIQRGDEPSPLAVVTLDRDGQARYSFHVGGAADRMVADPGELPGDTAALAVGAVSLMLEPGASVYAALVEREARRGRFVSLDPNVRPDLVDDPDALRARWDGFLPHVGLVKLSDEDAGWWGRTPEDMLAAGAGAVVLTRGADGLAAHTRSAGVVEVPAGHVGPVVDTIGAGDSVHAALLAWLHAAGVLDRAGVARLDAAGWRSALAHAARAAAWTCSRAGAEPPWTSELGGAPEPAGA